MSSHLFPHLTIILLGIGLALTAWFFVFGVTSSKKEKNIFKEIAVAAAASVFLGFGTVFLMLWVGIYV